MALTQTWLSGPAVISNSGTYGTSQYVVPAATSTIVKQIVLSNITASAQTITITLLPNAGSLADTMILFKDLALTEKETTFLNVSLVMNTGDSLYALCGAASSCNITASGIQVT